MVLALFDYNAVETTLLMVAVFVALGGVMFQVCDVRGTRLRPDERETACVRVYRLRYKRRVIMGSSRRRSKCCRLCAALLRVYEARLQACILAVIIISIVYFCAVFVSELIASLRPAW